MSEQLPPARPPRVEDARPGAATFDRLVESSIAIVESNGQLTRNVGKLVRVTYAVLATNAVLVGIVILLMWRHQ